MNFGEWEMQPFNEIKDPRIEEWYNDYLRVRTTGGESFEDQFNRVKEFLMEKKLSGKKKILVFAHGGVLICAKILTGMIDPKEAFSHLDNYGSVIRVEI
jgi:alpha-ribazole phosphatase